MDVFIGKNETKTKRQKEVSKIISILSSAKSFTHFTQEYG